MKLRILALATMLSLAFGGFRLHGAETDSQDNPVLGAEEDEPVFFLVKDRVSVPAREAGALVALGVEAGMTVEKGQVLGHIDDDQPRVQLRLAQAELAQAEKQASSPFDIKYSEKAEEAAKVDYQRTQEANRMHTGTVAELDVIYKKLTMEKQILQTQKSYFDKELAEMTVDIKNVEIEGANMMIQRRQVVAPIRGEVRMVHYHEGEWVNPGDVVVEIVNYETLYLEGSLNQFDYSPEMIKDKPVTVVVERENGRRVSASGKIVYVDGDIDVLGEFLVRAEIRNKEINGGWQLYPGLTGVMTIHVK